MHREGNPGNVLLTSRICLQNWTALLDNLFGQPYWTALLETLLDNLIGQPYWTALQTTRCDTIFIRIYIDAPPGVPGVSKN